MFFSHHLLNISQVAKETTELHQSELRISLILVSGAETSLSWWKQQYVISLWLCSTDWNVYIHLYSTPCHSEWVKLKGHMGSYHDGRRLHFQSHDTKTHKIQNTKQQRQTTTWNGQINNRSAGTVASYDRPGNEVHTVDLFYTTGVLRCWHCCNEWKVRLVTRIQRIVNRFLRIDSWGFTRTRTFRDLSLSWRTKKKTFFSTLVSFATIYSDLIVTYLNITGSHKTTLLYRMAKKISCHLESSLNRIKTRH